MDVIRKLKNAADVDIVDMNASWTTKTFPMGDNLHLCVHLFWDNIAVTGTMTLEYTGDPEAAEFDDSQDEAVSWVAKDITNIDGSFAELMYLDSNLPAACFRLKFQHLSGSSNLDSFVVRKKGW